MKFLKYMIYSVLGIIFFIVGSIYILSIRRDTKVNIENVEVAKNIVIPIEQIDSQKKYYGGHAMGFGGGDVKTSIKFSFKEINYAHKTRFIPIVIKMYRDDFYLVYYDRETDINNAIYRFYKSIEKGSFKEIKATKFPKHLAIQNRFWHDDSQPEDLIGLIPEKLVNTTTAYLWYLIEGKPEKYNWNTRMEFIKEYKEKYIINRKEE